MDELSTLAAYSGQVMEHSLRHEMLQSDFIGVQELLNTIAKTEQFRAVYVLDPSGQVIFGPEAADKGKRLDSRQADCRPCHQLSSVDRPRSVAVTAADGQPVFRSMYPIENRPACARCHEADQRLLGVVLTDVPMAPVKEMLGADLQENLLWGGGNDSRNGDYRKPCHEPTGSPSPPRDRARPGALRPR